MKDEGVRQIPFRDDRNVMNALEMQANLRGRSLSEEIRLAIRLWLAECLLMETRDPRMREAAVANGHDPAADEKQVRRQIERMKREALAVPDVKLRDVVLTHSDEVTVET
jgi:hypothetical protein